jgi:hypothetical protein
MLGTAWSNPFVNTLAWIRLYNTAAFNDLGTMAVDAGGNTYLWYQADESTEQVRLSRISPTGGVFLSAYQTFDPGSSVLAVQAAPDNFIYTSTNDILNSSFNFARISKYGAGMNLVWNHDFSSTGKHFWAIGFDVDKIGDVFSVVNQFDAGVETLHFIELNSNNQTISSTTASDIMPSFATRVGSLWLVVGNNLSITGPRWGLYDPATGTEFANEHDTNTNNMDGPGTGFQYTVIPVPNTTDVIVAKTTTTFQGIQPISSSYNLHEVTKDGVTVWTSADFTGLASAVYTQGPNQPIYVLTGDKLQILSGTGAQQSIKNFTLAELYFDSTGFFSFSNNFAQNTLVLKRYDLNATEPPQWSTVFTGTSTDQLSHVGSAILRGNVLYTMSRLFDTNSNYDVDIRRFVSGPVIVSIAGNGSNIVKENSTATIKVTLGQPAGPGGVLVNLSSPSSKLLFSNNTQRLDLAIPNGSNVTFVTVHALSVAADTPVVVTGTQNGIVKSFTMTIAH